MARSNWWRIMRRECAMAAKLPVISVVIPAFNAEPWIAETIASVLSQSIQREFIECIVVDNGSTDSTRAIAEQELAKSSIAWHVGAESRRGVAHARNCGLAW